MARASPATAARRAAGLGFLAGLALATVNCGTVTVTPGSTSILVRVSKAASFNDTVYAYLFTGTMNGAEAFADTQRPEVADGGQLNGPQALRVNFTDHFGG